MPGYSITQACVAAWLVAMVTGDQYDSGHSFHYTIDFIAGCMGPEEFANSGYLDVDCEYACTDRNGPIWTGTWVDTYEIQHCTQEVGVCPKLGDKRCMCYYKNNTCVQDPKVLVHGGWSSWTQVSPCTVTCGEGVYQRSRTCTNPAPSNGGRQCEGDSTSSAKCNAMNCSAFMFKNIIKDLADTISVDGVVTTWSRWGSCSSTCGGGSRTRVRSCVTPNDDGTPCSGGLDQTSSCSTNRCPECPLKPNPASVYGYLQLVHGRWMARPCAPGTMWVTSACRCGHPHLHEGK